MYENIKKLIFKKFLGILILSFLLLYRKVINLIQVQGGKL